MVDQYRSALCHLDAAMAAMEACGDTLAIATIAQAASIVGRGAAWRDLDPATAPDADRG